MQLETATESVIELATQHVPLYIKEAAQVKYDWTVWQLVSIYVVMTGEQPLAGS